MVAQVEGSSLQCAGNHGSAHYGEGIGDGIQELDAATTAVLSGQQHFIKSSSFNEAIGHHFVETGAGHIILDCILYIVQHGLVTLGNGQLRLMALDIIIAMHAGDFFADISIAFNITAPAGSSYHQLLALFFHAKAQFNQNLDDFFAANHKANATIDFSRSSGDYSRLYLFRICFHNTGKGFAGTHIFQQISCTV